MNGTRGVNMQPFNSGKKVFFLYPPQEFARNVIMPLFDDGFEIYKLNSSEKVLSLLARFPDSVLFINNDYPYEDFDITDFNDNFLKKSEFENLSVFSFFREKVSYGDKIRDYISIEREDQEVYQDIKKILLESDAHGKREYVRYGNYDEILSTITFQSNGQEYIADLHDISPKALSFSAVRDMNDLIGLPFHDMKLKVGTYEIVTAGRIDSGRTVSGKKIYIAVFDLDDKMRSEVFNFIFTSLEKGLDDLLKEL